MSETPTPPFALDRPPLHETSVREILARRFKDLRSASVRFLGHGWDFDAWLADERWLFRFPRKVEAVPWQARETALLTSIANRLPLQVPRPVRFGEAGDDFCYPFAAYAFVPGMGGDTMLPATTRWSAFAEQMGGFLGALQGISEADVSGPALSNDATTFPELVAATAAYRTELEHSLSATSLAAAAHVLDGTIAAPQPHSGALVLRHSDLFLEHLVFEPQSADLTGVIDWADAGWGDPAGDFVPFWVLFGDEFLEAMLRAHGGRFDEGARERIKCCGLVSLLRWIGESERWRLYEPRLSTWANDVFFPRLRRAGIPGR